jgi:outer membrane protein with beta-barrel domain
MKNLIKSIAFLLVLVLATGTYAQSTIGLRGGINLATMNNDPFEYANADMNKGFMIGADVAIFAKINVADIFSVQPEFHWVQKGVKSTMTTTDNMDVEMIYRYNYLELPVLARLDFEVGESVSLNIYAGPSAGYAINKEFIGKNARLLGTEDPFQKGDYNETIDWDNEYGDNGVKDNRFDISAVGGIGVAFETEVGNFILDARYSHDFNDAFNYENTPDPKPDKFYNRGISITAGFAFPLGM